jgi:hypothetical protein
MKRQTLLTAVISALAASAIAGGVAWASIPDTSKVFSACMLNGVGTIRLIDKSLPSTNFMSHCTDRETEVSWNQQGLQGLQGIQGPAGKDGTSVTNTAESAGANCANGGSRFTVGAGIPTFACNGKDGTNGTNGTNGTDGKDGAPGKDGASVTNVTELPGPNCPNGGSRFMVGAGLPTFACNGQDGTSGTIKQVSDHQLSLGESVHQTTDNFIVDQFGFGSLDLTAHCNAGDILVGGGYSGDFVKIRASRPTAAGWEVEGYISDVAGPPGLTPFSITAYALCVTPLTSIATTSVFGP